MRERSKLSGTCFYGNVYNVIILTPKAKQFRCARLGGYTFPVIKKYTVLKSESEMYLNLYSTYVFVSI